MPDKFGFEVREIIDLKESGISPKTIMVGSEKTIVELTTMVSEFIFGNIKISLEKEGSDVLIIEDMSLDSKGLKDAGIENKILAVGPPPEKGKPGGPAGSNPPPKVIVKPKPR